MSDRRSIRLLLPSLSLLSLIWAQRDLGTLTGTVTDPAAAVIASAKVTITEDATGLVYSVTTDSSGIFVRPALKPGIYTVEVESPGFKKAIQKGVLLTAGDRVGVNMSLQIGGTTESVEISAAAPLLQTEDTIIGGGLNSRSVAELPLGAQRKIAFLARLSIGVVVQENGMPDTLGGGFAAAGMPSLGTNNYLLNGVDNNQNNIDYQGNAGYVVSLPPEAVSEVRVQTSGYNAEYGRGGGGVMDVTVKSGTNGLHGVAYEFLQNEDLNTNSWDANKAGSAKGVWRQNQFGVSAGGPLIRNRTFWFANYEGYRFNSFGGAVPGQFGAATSYTIPTPAMVQGNFSGELGAVVGTDALGNQVRQGMIYDFLSTTPNGQGGYTRLPFPNDTIPLSRMDPAARMVLSELPNPDENLGSAVPGSNYFAPALALQHNDQGTLRIDHKISDKDQLFGTLVWSNGFLSNPPPAGLSAEAGSLEPGYYSTLYSRLAMLSYTRIWTPSILTETRVAYTRSVQDRQTSNFNVDDYQVYGIAGYDPKSPNAGGGLPAMTIDGYSTLGGPNHNPSLEYSNVYDFIQNLAITRGKHAFKFGFEYHSVGLPFFQPNYPHGAMNFSKNFTNDPQTGFSGVTGDGIASLELGYPSAFSLSTATLITNEEHHAFAGFAQDDWKVTPKLTLNVGVRYELFSPFTDRFDNQANLVYNSNGTLTYAIGPGPGQNTPLSPGVTALLSAAGVTVTRGQISSYMVPWDKTDFGPRIGLAYQIQPKTVIRAGFGMFYSGEQNRGSFTPLDLNPPFNEDIIYTGPTYTLNPYVTRLSNGFPTNIYNLNIPGSLSLHGEAPDLLTPRVDKWNLSVQRELPGNTALEVSYLGNYMSHLLVEWDPNMPPNSPNVNVAANSLNSIRPDPALGSVQGYISSFGYGNYNALGAKFEKRFSHGLQFAAVYTWGHVIAAAPTSVWAQGNVNSPQANNMSAMYASPPWDIRHNFVLNAIYELPFGKGRPFGGNWNPILQGVLGNWQINGIETLHTGHYFTLNTLLGTGYFGYKTAGGGNLIYPSVAPGQSAGAAPPGGSTPNEWFNTANIVAPAPYTQGNLGNSTNEFPGVANLDFSLFKEFPFKERFKLTLRAEVFNMFNHPNFASIGSTQGMGNFGQLLTTVPGTNRRGQLGLNLAF